MELMVVVSIIVLLVALLAPALSKVFEMARVASCRSNLHAHGVAWGCYLADNNQTFPQYFLNMQWCYGGKQPAVCEAPPGGGGSTPLNDYRPLNPYLQLPLKNVNKAEYFHCPSDHGIQASNSQSSIDGYSCYDWFGNSYLLNPLIMMQIDNPVTFDAPSYKVKENGRWTWYFYPFQSTMATIPTSQLIVSGDAQWIYVAEGNTSYGASFHDNTNRVNLLFLDGHVVFTQMQFGLDVTSDYSDQPFPPATQPGP
jgi:prepilin-type processing-associated H-X9-DG protein